MSAELLRRAAANMRESEDINYQLGRLNQRELRTWLAVADWLDDSADAFEAYIDRQADPERRFASIWLARAQIEHQDALAVAHAYLGETP